MRLAQASSLIAKQEQNRQSITGAVGTIPTAPVGVSAVRTRTVNCEKAMQEIGPCVSNKVSRTLSFARRFAAAPVPICFTAHLLR